MTHLLKSELAADNRQSGLPPNSTTSEVLVTNSEDDPTEPETAATPRPKWVQFRNSARACVEYDPAPPFAADVAPVELCGMSLCRYESLMLVKLRRIRREHMFSDLLSNSALATDRRGIQNL
jgi:hypothetical protein